MFKIMIYIPSKMLCCFLVLASLTSNGQGQRMQYGFIHEASQYMKDLYSQSVRYQFFQGIKYVPIQLNRMVDKGDPYFLRSKLEDETVTIHGVQFSKVPITFDLIFNKVVSMMPGTTVPFSLVNENVDQFTIEGHTFINIRDSTIRQLGFEPGYYDLLFDGDRIKAFAKRIKKYSESSNTIRYGAIIQKIYVDDTILFVWKEGRYTIIKNRKAVLSLLKDRQTNPNLYVDYKKQRLTKGSLEEMLVTASKLYEGL